MGLVIFVVPVSALIYCMVCLMVSDSSIIKILNQSISRGQKRLKTPEKSSPSEVDEELPQKKSEENSSPRSIEEEANSEKGKSKKPKINQEAYTGIKINTVLQRQSKERRIKLSKGNELQPQKGESDKQISLTAKTKQRKMQLANPYAQQ